MSRAVRSESVGASGPFKVLGTVRSIALSESRRRLPLSSSRRHIRNSCKSSSRVLDGWKKKAVKILS